MYTMEAIKVLPGYKIVELIYELKRTLVLLRSYVDDIENIFDNFKNVDELDHWFETESSLLALRFDISKAAFGAASTAYALRELQGYVCGTKQGEVKKGMKQYISPESYSSVRSKIAGDSGLADFVFHLRDYSTHRSVISADWEVRYGESEQQKSFLLKQDKLLKNDFWTPASRKFIKQNGDVDVKEVFVRYYEIAKSLTDWFTMELQSQHDEILKEYIQCLSVAYYARLSYEISLRRSREDLPTTKPFSETEIDEICSSSDRYELALTIQRLAEGKYNIDPVDIVFKTLI